MADARPRTGLRVAQYGSDWPTLVRQARHAERLGFDSLWVNDHLRTPGRLSDLPAFDAFSTLAALAPLTERVRLGFAVLSASYRPPALAAKMATVIDVISSGRVTIGLGTGSDRGEHRAYGIPFDSAAERTHRAERAFRTLRAMLEQPRGEGARAGAHNLPGPVHAPPLWIAANRPRLLRFAGRHADGIVVAFSDPSGVRERLEVAGAARGDGQPELSCALYSYVLPLDSPDDARAWLGAECARLGTTPERMIRWLSGTGLVGTTAELRAAIAAHAAAGVTDLILVLPNGVPDEAITAVAEACLEPTPAPAATGRSGRDNLVDLLIEGHRRDGRGGDLAVIDGDDEVSFNELARIARNAAGQLRRRDVRPGDRVIVALRDGVDWVRAACGALWCGAVIVPLDPAIAPDALGRIVSDCDPALVVAEADVALPPGCGRATPRELTAPSDAPLHPAHGEDLAYLIYSSGSTGRPKAAMHCHADPAFSVASYAREILGLEPGQRSHSLARLFTSFGFGNGFFRPLGAGATAVMSGTRPTVRSLLELVAHRRVDVVSAVPTYWAQLATFLERHRPDDPLGAARLLVSSGDSLPGPVADRLVAQTGRPLVEGLGCSECSNTVVSWRPGEHLPGLLGRAITGVEIKLADDEGRPVTPGEPGRLWIRSPSNTSGYWRRRDLTRDLVHGSWLRMGDMLREVEPGLYTHLGRTDDLFKVDAQWVSPREVEACLLEADAVREAAVAGAPDERGLMRVVAWVSGGGESDDALTKRLRRHVADRLGARVAPAEVRRLDELPRLPSGKLDRRRLRLGREPVE